MSIGGLTFPPGSTLKVDYVNGCKEGDGIVYSSKKIKLHCKISGHKNSDKFWNFTF